MFFLSCALFWSLSSQARGPIVISGGGNPAAVLCEALQGVSTIVQTPKGQVGLCLFGKAVIDQWTLFHSVKNNHNTEAVLALTQNQPADCQALGAEIKEGYDSSSNTMISLCEFSDGSLLGTETLQRGLKAPANRKLIKALHF